MASSWKNGLRSLKQPRKSKFFYFSDVFVTTDIHNAACIPPSAKRPNNVLQPQQPPHTHGQPLTASTVPFSPMDQMEELDVVAAYCGSYPTPSASAASAAASTAVTAVTANGGQPVEVDSLEKALGIEFHDPNVVQRQLMAK